MATTEVRMSAIHLNSGVLIMVINDCILSINEFNQHDKNMVINVEFF